jgi:hypothetical protein
LPLLDCPPSLACPGSLAFYLPDALLHGHTRRLWRASPIDRQAPTSDFRQVRPCLMVACCRDRDHSDCPGLYGQRSNEWVYFSAAILASVAIFAYVSRGHKTYVCVMVFVILFDFHGDYW